MILYSVSIFRLKFLIQVRLFHEPKKIYAFRSTICGRGLILSGIPVGIQIFWLFLRGMAIGAFSFKVIIAAAAAAHYLLDSYPPTSKSGVVIFAFTYSYSNERFYRQNTIKM